MTVRDFILGVTAMLTLITLGMAVMGQRDLKVSQKSYSSLAIKIQADSASRCHLESQIDSLKIANQALAKSIVYLDSCNQAKAIKADRAEKRGRFVGGLLKGLFPGL